MSAELAVSLLSNFKNIHTNQRSKNPVSSARSPGGAGWIANELTEKILDRRQAGHTAAAKKGIGMAGTRILGPLQAIFETNSYAAVRGAEHLMKDQYGTVKQINPIGPKNDRKNDYLDCAKYKGAIK